MSLEIAGVMAGFWIMANLGFWAGYLAGKHRYQDDDTKALCPDELDRIRKYK